MLSAGRKLQFLYDEIASIRIYYFLPDHQHLLQEFLWQTVDFAPLFTKTHKFIEFWKTNIEAKIHEIEFAHTRLTNSEFTNAKKYLKI
jgi:uncharacterized protein Usg